MDGFERLALVLAWAATIAVFGWLRPDSFLTWSNFATIFGSQSVIVVIALGLIIPLTAGDYDLSIANNLTFAATVLAVLNVNHRLADRARHRRRAGRGARHRRRQRVLRALFPHEFADRHAWASAPSCMG